MAPSEAANVRSASAFSLRWPLVELTGSVPLNKCLDRIVRRLDHALTNSAVRYHAYPAMRAASRQGITVWVCRSDAGLARLIMVRLGLIEPSPTAKERAWRFGATCTDRCALNPKCESNARMTRLFSMLDRFFIGPPGKRTHATVIHPIDAMMWLEWSLSHGIALAKENSPWEFLPNPDTLPTGLYEPFRAGKLLRD